MKIAIASGKGGTGKSTVSVNFAYLASKIYDNVCLLDCDVEEPNCHIFLKPDFEFEEKVFLPTPQIDLEKCIKCGKCAEVCQYNALAFIKDKVLVFEELCHGCGSCNLICPCGAISDKGRELGVLQEGKTGNLNFIQGKTRISEAMSPPLINAVKKRGEQKNFLLQILDCPPGTSCPVIASVEDADYVFMVTEPTPFGLYDLKLAVDVMQKLKLNFGIIINRSNENDALIENYAKENDIKILTKIPDERKIAEFYSKGEVIVEKIPELERAFLPLIEIVRNDIK